MKRVTVKDIAKRSGCSVATVSKTLNGTDRVGAETMERIRRIAEEMGYRSNLSAQALVRKPRRVAIVIFRCPAEVRQLFEEGFARSFNIYEEFGIEPVYHRFASSDSIDWNQIAEDADAMIVTPAHGFENALDTLNEIGRRMPLVILQTLPSVLPVHLCEVTVDARAVGAMAAQLLSLCTTGGQTAILTGYADSWIHRENICGFQRVAQEYGINNIAIEECFDDMDRAYDVTRCLLEKHSGLGGIFVTSYVSPAVCRCIADMKRDVRVVGVDLFGNSADCLRRGTLSAAIFQNQQRQAQIALEAVVDSFRNLPLKTPLPVKPEIVLKSNLSCYECI